MVSTRFLISKSFRPWTNALVTVKSAPVSIGITVTFMFLHFFPVYLQGLDINFSFRFHWVLPSGQQERQIPLFDRGFLLIITRSGRLAEIRWSICISKSKRTSCVSFSRTDSVLCIHHLFVWSDFNLLHSSKRDHFSHRIVTSLVLFRRLFTAFTYNVVDSFVSITTLSASAILLRLVYSCFDLVLIALFCTAIRRDSGLVWFVGFYGISTFVGYLTLNPFLCKLSVLFKTIQFNISTQFNYQKHFHFKLFKQLYVAIQLSVNTVLMPKNSSISNNSVNHSPAV